MSQDKVSQDKPQITCSKCNWEGSPDQLKCEIDLFVPTDPPIFRCPECHQVITIKYLGIMPGTEICQILTSHVAES